MLLLIFLKNDAVVVVLWLKVFFVVRLHIPSKLADLPPVSDPDALIANDLMDGRDPFLMMARDRHYEFSSLRRAKFSSMAMLYELHTQARDSFVYTCNSCHANVDTRYHCSVCDVSTTLAYYSSTCNSIFCVILDFDTLPIICKLNAYRWHIAAWYMYVLSEFVAILVLFVGLRLVCTMLW